MIESKEEILPNLPFLEMSQELCNLFGIDDKYFLLIIKEATDWEFITKMGALYEAGATQILVQGLARKELRKDLALLPLCGERNSKEAFIKSMGLMTEMSLGKMRQFAFLRNQTVHNSQNFKIRLDEFMLNLKKKNPNKLKELQKTFFFDCETHSAKDTDDIFTKRYQTDLQFRIRLGMSAALTFYMMEVYLNKTGHNMLEEEKNLKIKLDLKGED